MKVQLLNYETDRVTVHTEASVLGRRGALRIEGEDWGPMVEQLWGRDDHEYILTVAAEHRDTIQVMLVVERFGSDAGLLAGWLDTGRYRTDGLAGGEIDAVQVLHDGRVRVETTDGQLTVAANEFDRMTLEMLKDLFDSKRFTSDAAVGQWLEDHGIPSDLWVY